MWGVTSLAFSYSKQVSLSLSLFFFLDPSFFFCLVVMFHGLIRPAWKSCQVSHQEFLFAVYYYIFPHLSTFENSCCFSVAPTYDRLL